MDFKQKLFTYIQCSFPIIYIETLEIDRAIKETINTVEMLNKWLPNSNADMYLKQNGFKIYKWNCVSGITDIQTGEQVYSGTEPPTQALEQVMMDEKMGAIYIFENLHLHLQEARKPQLIAFLRMFYDLGKKVNKHIIIISPVIEIPIEIKDLITVIEFKLPTKEEITNFIISNFFENKCPFSKDEIEQIAEAGAGMTLNEIENAVAQSLALTKGKKLDKQFIFNEKINIVKRSGLLDVVDTTEGLTEVGGLQKFKEWAYRIANIMNNRKKAEEYNLPMPKGCLLFGVPGTGKTLIAKALAKEFKTPLYKADIGRLFGSLVGETEAKTREFFKLVEALAPCVILFDEIEKAMAGLESSTSTDSGVTARLIGSFLYFMQEKKIPAYFVATANNINALPPEMLRAGRWDELWFVDLPSFEERIEIFKIHISKLKRDYKKYEPISELSEKTNKYTGAEIEAIMKIASYNAFYENREFNRKDILDAIKEVKPIADIKAEVIESLRAWASGRAKTANSSIDVKQKNSKRKIICQNIQ